MTSGTGITGNVGGPQQPTVHELESSAATEVMKAMVGILADTLEKPFSQLDRDATWKYKSNSNNPSLAPMIRVRVSTAPTTLPDETWTAEFNRLLDLLPEDIRASYLAEAKLPAEQRDPAFGSLDNVLGMAASFLTWVDGATKPMDPARVSLSHMAEYEALPDVLRDNFLQSGKDVLKSIDATLQQIGHSSPQFDRMSRAYNEMNELFSKFQSLASQGDQVSKEAWGELATKLESLGHQLESASIGDDMHIIQDNVEALSLIATAASLKSGSPSLFLSLSLAATGINASESSTGVSPPLMEKIVAALSEDLLATLVSHNEPGSEKLLPLLIRGMLTGATALAMLGSDTKSLDLILGLNLLESSGVLQSLGQGVASAGGVAEKNQSQASDALSCASLLLLVYVLSVYNKKASGDTVESMNGPLDKLLESMGNHFAANQSSQTEYSRQIDTLLVQLKLALRELDIFEFLSKLSNSADEIAADAMKLNAKMRLEKLRNFVDILQIIATANPRKMASTGVVMA